MSQRYFDLSDDVYLQGRWELGHPRDAHGIKLEDPWQFGTGRPARWTESIRIPVKIQGTPLDYSHAAFSIPVVSARVAEVFKQLSPNDVQILPVDVDGQSDAFFIVNAIRRVNCIDEEASEEVRYWMPEDGLPEKLGTYFSVWGMRLDAARIGSPKVFRPLHWEVALVVTGDIKDALEFLGATGTRFKDVSPLR